ncbi:MAG TPA: phage minor head protein [Phycisphaerae bacterium]|nr:phage minor head protein [Phycisphaerae bacterium]
MCAASKYARRQAQIYDNDCRQIEDASQVAVKKITRKIRLVGINSWNQSGNIDSVVNAVRQAVHEEAGGFLADLMVAAHLRSSLRAIQTATDFLQKRKELYTVKDNPYKKARDYLVRRMDLKDREVESLNLYYTREAVNVTNAADELLERNLRQAAVEAVGKGAHTREGVAIFRDAFEKSGINPESPWLLETLVRTQTQLAYSAGRWNVNDDSAVQEILWGYEYVTVGDDRVRPSHAALDGCRYAKDDPIWNKIFPPNGYNCRCTTIEIFKGDRLANEKPAKPIDIDGQKVFPSADKGWNFNPGRVGQDMAKIELPPNPQPSVRRIIPQMTTGKPMTMADQKNVIDYTSTDYMSIVRAQLGKPMRGQNMTKEQALEKAHAVEAALFKLPGKEAVSYRGMAFKSARAKADFLASLQTEGKYTFEAFQSASLLKEFPEKLAKDRKRGLLFMIDGKTGRDISKYSLHPEEKEILFLQGVECKIEAIIDNYIVHCREV